jgi:hypothetical protein
VSLAQQWILIVYVALLGLLWLHHIPSLADVTTVVSKATMVTNLFSVGQKRTKGISGFRYKGSVDTLGTAL